MANCPICGEKLGMLNKAKASDGAICAACSFICASSETRSISDLQKFWDINHSRWEKFSITQEIKSMGTDAVSIDAANRFFVFGSVKKVKREPIVYSFDEVQDYTIEVVGQKTVTKKKGGITRAVVGGVVAGPVGALVGSGTSKAETKTTGGHNQLKVILNTYAGKKQRIFDYYPLGLPAFLDRCIDEAKPGEPVQAAVQATASAADEILKYKGLLDAGIITQEEFEAKKKQLLGL